MENKSQNSDFIEEINASSVSVPKIGSAMRTDGGTRTTAGFA
jgi:hypothetical protein